MATPIDRLKARIASGELSPDADQERAAVALGELRARLAKWKPGKRGLFAKPKPAPKGLYLWGGSGAASPC